MVRPEFGQILAAILTFFFHAMLESGAGSSSTRTFQVHFPSPLVNVVKRGDTMTLQICHLEQGGVWVPYMYS